MKKGKITKDLLPPHRPPPTSLNFFKHRQKKTRKDTKIRYTELEAKQNR